MLCSRKCRGVADYWNLLGFFLNFTEAKLEINQICFQKWCCCHYQFFAVFHRDCYRKLSWRSFCIALLLKKFYGFLLSGVAEVLAATDEPFDLECSILLVVGIRDRDRINAGKHVLCKERLFSWWMTCFCSAENLPHLIAKMSVFIIFEVGSGLL